MKKLILLLIISCLSFLLLLYSSSYQHPRKKNNATKILDTSVDTMTILPTPTINETPTPQISTNDIEPTTTTIISTKESLRQLPATTVIDTTNLNDELLSLLFYHEEIGLDIKNRIMGKSYGVNCVIPLEELRYIRVLYYGFDKETHIGELIVNSSIADDIVAIFLELYKIHYPIERMVLVDEYDADDNLSMASNNTSAFNYRTIPGSNNLSKHAKGLAIDINPLYNPYVVYQENTIDVLPIEGYDYVDRTLNCEYYIKEGDVCYNAFIQRGFTWGGAWKSSSDYQHFQKNN